MSLEEHEMEKAEKLIQGRNCDQVKSLHIHSKIGNFLRERGSVLLQARGIGSVVPLTLCNMGDRMHTQKFSHPQLHKFLFYFAMCKSCSKSDFQQFFPF